VRLALAAADRLAEVVRSGATRVVLDPGPLPEGDEALWSAVRRARLALREVVPA
jgi:hypothetical protein